MGITTLTTFCGVMDVHPPVCFGVSSPINNDRVLEASKKAAGESNIATLVDYCDKTSAGTLFVSPCLVEANNEEHEGSDNKLSDVSDDSDLSNHEATDLPPSVRGNKETAFHYQYF